MKHLLSKLLGTVEEVKRYNEELVPRNLEEMELGGKYAQGKNFTNSVLTMQNSLHAQKLSLWEN